MMQSRRNAMHVPDRPGIYKLYSRKAGGDLKLVYIGRATSLRKRVTSHNKPLWDECTFEVVTEENIRELMEKHLISEFKPPYNQLEYVNPFDPDKEESTLWAFLEEDQFLCLDDLAEKLGEAPFALEEIVGKLCDEGLLETKFEDGEKLYNVSGAVEMEADVANVVDDSRFNESEEEILSAFIEADGFVSYEDLAHKVGKPDRIKALRSRVSDLSEKIDFETKRDGKKVKYKLAENTRQQVKCSVEDTQSDREKNDRNGDTE